MLKALFNNLIGRVGDKWTMIILEVLREHGELRFTQLPHVVRWRRSGDADAVASRHRERRHGDANPGQLMCSTQQVSTFHLDHHAANRPRNSFVFV